ncbi:hypothetical protein Clacol_007750 [Clathrus columnatus]|uniref:Uncharacterized protein n=1 Tax=Clathrus columnatus TaxID=1419009 RepID=A0AAV5AKM7_9AGAM|nr:hypothetical protein Clacol_007750 [Clathrus columnatus]
MDRKNDPSLHFDIFQSYIIPDILSQHIHSILIDQEQPSWRPFYVLPLVCRAFNQTCRSLIIKIFGIDAAGSQSTSRPNLADDDSDSSESESDYDSGNELTPADMLQYAITVSQRAQRPDSQSNQTYHFHTMETLLEQTSLIRVYTCLALGKLFLNVDIFRPLGVFNGENSHRTERRNLWDEDYDDHQELWGQTNFDEANLHRYFMPLECAQIICDRIVPDRLAMIAARYMAQILPFYHSLHMLTKYSRDLRFNLDREYDLKLIDYTEWVIDSLILLENTEVALDDIMQTGQLIYSFWTRRKIPKETLKLSGIIEALDDVIRAEWFDVPTTLLIRKKATVLILKWTGD